MHAIACPFCDVDNGEIAIRENGYTGKKCADCSLIYITPRPSIKEITDLYGHGDAHQSAEAHIASQTNNRLYARHHLKLLKKHIKSGSLLEIGAAAGYFLDESRKAGFKPFGIELDPVQAEYVKKAHNIHCETKPLGDAYKNQKFDVIYHCDVISHFYEPVAEFKNINGAMSEGSILMFETGNFADMSSSYYSEIPKFQYPDHLFFFGENTIKEILERTGFELVEIHKYSILPQLRFRKLLHRLKPGSSLNNASNTALSMDFKNKPARSRLTIGSKSRIKSIANWALAHVFYFTRYYIGSITANDKKPQTMLVIAQKTKEV